MQVFAWFLWGNNMEKKDSYLTIPNEILQKILGSELSGTAIKIYLYLFQKSYAGIYAENLYKLTTSSIAEDLSINKRGVNRSLELLENEGFIERQSWGKGLFKTVTKIITPSVPKQSPSSQDEENMPKKSLGQLCLGWDKNVSEWDKNDSEWDKFVSEWDKFVSVTEPLAFTGAVFNVSHILFIYYSYIFHTCVCGVLDQISKKELKQREFGKFLVLYMRYNHDELDKELDKNLNEGIHPLGIADKLISKFVHKKTENEINPLKIYEYICSSKDFLEEPKKQLTENDLEWIANHGGHSSLSNISDYEVKKLLKI